MHRRRLPHPTLVAKVLHHGRHIFEAGNPHVVLRVVSLEGELRQRYRLSVIRPAVQLLVTKERVELVIIIDDLIY